MEYCINLRNGRGTASDPFPAWTLTAWQPPKQKSLCLLLHGHSANSCQVQCSHTGQLLILGRAILSKLSDKLSRSVKAEYRDKPTGQAAEIRQLISRNGRPWNSRRVKMLSTSVRLLNKSSREIVQESCRCYGGGLLEGTASLWSGLAALNVHFTDQL